MEMKFNPVVPRNATCVVSEAVVIMQRQPTALYRKLIVMAHAI